VTSLRFEVYLGRLGYLRLRSQRLMSTSAGAVSLSVFALRCAAAVLVRTTSFISGSCEGRSRSSNMWGSVWASGLLIVLVSPAVALAQADTEFVWESGAVGQATPADAVVSISDEAAGPSTSGQHIEATCAGFENGGIVVGSADPGGRCEVPYAGTAYSLQTYELLTGPPAAWETPAVPAAAEALPEERMVVAGADSTGASVYPCRATGACRQWSSADPCELSGAPVGQVAVDSAANSACIVAESDYGTCICGEFDVLVLP
jgi:hypothetical protein